MNTRPLLWPIAVVQGLWLLYRTPSLPVPPGDSGRVGPAVLPSLKLTGVGDSIMVGTGVREQRHSLTASFARQLQARLGCAVDWRVHGRVGATSGQILRQLVPDVQAAHVYLVSCGVNDMIHQVPVAEYARNFAGILAALRQKSPLATVLYGGLPPLESFPALPWPLRSVLAERAADMRTATARVVAEHRRVYCFEFPPSMSPDHFASDGFHPHELACERWATGLLELWPQNPTRHVQE